MSEQATLSYQVMMQERPVDHHRLRQHVIDSSHASLEQALERCREIIFRDLDSLHQQVKSCGQCVRDYVDNGRRPWVQPSDGRKRVAYSRAEQEWLAARVAQDWPGVIEWLRAAKPQIPRGWFRWLHHSYLSRMPSRVDLQLAAEWRAAALVVAQDRTKLTKELNALLETHAWEAGRHGVRSLAEACWQQLSGDARGRFLAGFSNLIDHRKDLSMEFSNDVEVGESEESAACWLLARLGDADLSAECVLEIACNAIWNKSELLLSGVIHHGAARLGEDVDRMEPFSTNEWSKDGYHSEGIRCLSNKVVDMMLEAAVLRRHLAGVRLALNAGASPSLSLWALERNSNEHFTAVSFAIGNEAPEMARLLLAAGACLADKNGSKCLFLAVRSSDFAMADLLLEGGANFDHGDKPSWLAASVPGDGIERDRSMFFNCHGDDIAMAQSLGRGLPLAHASEAAWFYQGDGQGGRYSTMLSHFLYHDDLDGMRHFHSKGMALHLTLPDFAIALKWGAYGCLVWMLLRWGSPTAVMLRIRRKIPEFGTQRRLWMLRPDVRAVGLMKGFDTEGLAPFPLPDGGRFWVDLTGVAIADMQVGPAWSRNVTVQVCRRAQGVVLRDVALTWEIKPLPINDYMLRAMIPLVKEIDGAFLHTGLTLDSALRQDYPQGWRERVKNWSEGDGWNQLRSQILERAAQNQPEG